MYEDKTFENIMKSMLARCREDVDKREGSIIYDSTAAVAYHLAEMYFLLENYLNLIFPDTSAGEYLDRFAMAFHMKRKAATKAVREGRFDREIPIGSRFITSGDSSLVFTVTMQEDAADGVYTYLMECETAGKDGNASFDGLMPVEYISGLGTAELGEVIVSGTEEETDEALRERLFAKIKRPSTSGNVNDYYNWAMNCAGVGAAKVFPLADGPGTVTIVIADEDKSAADQTLVHHVADYIEEMRPIGALVTVKSVEEKEVGITAKVKLSTGTNLGLAQAEFQKIADQYLRANAFGIEYISLARIGNLLMDVAGVEDYNTLLLNCEPANIELADNEIAVIGTVRLEIM